MRLETLFVVLASLIGSGCGEVAELRTKDVPEACLVICNPVVLLSNACYIEEDQPSSSASPILVVPVTTVTQRVSQTQTQTQSPQLPPSAFAPAIIPPQVSTTVTTTVSVSRTTTSSSTQFFQVEPTLRKSSTTTSTSTSTYQTWNYDNNNNNNINEYDTDHHDPPRPTPPPPNAASRPSPTYSKGYATAQASHGVEIELPVPLPVVDGGPEDQYDYQDRYQEQSHGEHALGRRAPAAHEKRDDRVSKADQEKAERFCLCQNRSFDVQSLAGLCASCMAQNTPANSSGQLQDINQIMSDCAFTSTTFTPEATRLAEDLTIVALVPTIVPVGSPLANGVGSGGGGDDNDEEDMVSAAAPTTAASELRRSLYLLAFTTTALLFL